MTQEQRGEQELTVCYDVQTGQPQWSHAQPGRFSSVMAGDGPRATPTIADGHVFVLGAAGVLQCLDGATGQPVWSAAHEILQESKADNLQWGLSGSPLIVDNLVVVGAGGRDGHSLLAYESRSGEPVWTAGNDPSAMPRRRWPPWRATGK